jgi:SAM-dependent methyltransferase
MNLVRRLCRRFPRLGREPATAATPRRSIPASRCESLGQFHDLLQATQREREEQLAVELSLLPPAADPFTVAGHCLVCERAAAFRVGYAHGFDAGDGRMIPNWREHLTCPGCRLNNRMRAALAFLGEGMRRRDRLYLTEQVTPLFRVASRRFASVVGSEFLRDGTPPGRSNAAGVRHEDLTRLTLPAAAFDRVGTFDVLEHIPDHRAALANLHRCLKPGGVLVMTVPFALLSPTHTVRATVGPDGSVRHLMPPEYHGDPLDPAGALCFYHFGWELLDDLRRCGFADAALHFYWSRELGFLGGTQFVIRATRR